MPSAGSTVKRDERRRAVLRAAVGRFANRGFHATTTAEIASAAGISQPYVYRLFSSKQALFVAAVRFVSDLLVAARAVEIERLTDADRNDPGCVMLALQQGYRTLVDEDRELVKFLGQASCTADDPVIAEALRACYAEQHALLVDRAGLTDDQVRSVLGAELLSNVVATLEIDQISQPWARALSGDHDTSASICSTPSQR